VQDFYFVRQKFKKYQLGEVAHVENVLPGEHLARVLDRTTTTEDVREDYVERIEETEKDLVTNERVALQRETSKAISSEASVKAGFKFGYSGGGVEIATDLSASYQQSEQQSERVAQNFTREVSARARQRLQETTHRKDIRRVTTQVRDYASHGIDNAGQTETVGIYKFIDKVYDLETYQFDSKVVIDLTLPEPAALLLERFAGDGENGPLSPAVEPFTLTPAAIAEDTYLDLGAKYGVFDLPQPPPYSVTVSKAQSIESGATDELQNNARSGAARAEELRIPKGFYVYGLRAWAGVAPRQKNLDAELHLQVGGLNLFLKTQQGLMKEDTASQLSGLWEHETVPVGVTATNAAAFSAVVELDCLAGNEAVNEWRSRVFQSLREAHQRNADRVAAEQRVRNAVGGGEFTSPGSSRALAHRELKRSLISLLSEQSFDWAGAIADGPGAPGERFPAIDFALARQQADYIQFFEMAFEWNLLQYVPYPYFWGRKDRWPALLALHADDPEMLDFLSSGAVRVVVPIRQEWVPYVENFLRTGQWPSAADFITGSATSAATPGPGYVSIAQQIEEIKAKIPKDGRLLPDVTEVIVPTNMVILADDSDLKP
jgi:hypothetical protein